MAVFQLDTFPVLQTKRLILREHEESDAPALFAMRTDERVMCYIDRERPDQMQKVHQLIADMRKGFAEGTMLAWAMAFRDKPEELIGSIGYWRMDMTNFRAEIGYMLHPDHWRKGLVSEALAAAEECGFGLLNLHSIMANINPENRASADLLIKAGYVQEAYFRENYYFNGRFLDSEIYGKLRPPGQ